MRSGEIWLVNFSPSIGHEIAKVRPALLIGDETLGALDLSLVIPLTDSQKFAQPWHVPVKRSPLNKLKKDSVVDCFQIKSVSHQRFQRKIGALSQADMDEVKLCLISVLDLA